jgi:hypothetical protein
VKAANSLWICIRFLFGLVGFFICIGSGINALANNYSVLPMLLLSAVGLLMMLFGVGRWGQWHYLWVFGSMPFFLIVLPWFFFEMTNSVMPAPLAFVPAIIVPFIILRSVRKFYSKRNAQ